MVSGKQDEVWALLKSDRRLTNVTGHHVITHGYIDVKSVFSIQESIKYNSF